VTLLMACLVMTGWVRSHFVADEISFEISNSRHTLYSVRGRLAWIWCLSLINYDPKWFSSPRWSRYPINIREGMMSEREIDELPLDHRCISARTTQHGSAALLFGLLSALLLFSKQPPAKRHDILQQAGSNRL
jgi:hypothetical protein